ncbi:MAG: helix-turn-helix domain-containing protein [Butyrivibrio sp.]|nr:helix-turn-helix domain-containing protein [Butyrivibrio sp.]
MCYSEIHIPTIDMERTGQNIINLRQERGLSVRDIQDVFGFVTPQAIYKWQHGTALPSIDNLVVLAAILQVQIDDILVTSEEAVMIGA